MTPAPMESSPPQVAARPRVRTPPPPGAAPLEAKPLALPRPTSAQGLRVVPVGVPEVDALNDRWALLQGVAGVAGELHDGPEVVGSVGGGEVAILQVGLIAVALLKSWEGHRRAELAQAEPQHPLLRAGLAVRPPMCPFGARKGPNPARKQPGGQLFCMGV